MTFNPQNASWDNVVSTTTGSGQKRCGRREDGGRLPWRCLVEGVTKLESTKHAGSSFGNRPLRGRQSRGRDLCRLRTVFLVDWMYEIFVTLPRLHSSVIFRDKRYWIGKGQEWYPTTLEKNEVCGHRCKRRGQKGPLRRRTPSNNL